MRLPGHYICRSMEQIPPSGFMAERTDKSEFVMSNNSGTLLLLLLALVGSLWAISSSDPKKIADKLASGAENQEEILARHQENRRFFLILKRPILRDLGLGKITLRVA